MNSYFSVMLVLLLLAPACNGQSSFDPNLLDVKESSILSDTGVEHTLSVYLPVDAVDAFESLTALPGVRVHGDSLSRALSFSWSTEGSSVALHVDSMRMNGKDRDWVWVTFYDRSGDETGSVLDPSHKDSLS